jgi:hypothetical protein
MKRLKYRLKELYFDFQAAAYARAQGDDTGRIRAKLLAREIERTKRKILRERVRMVIAY